MPSFPHVAIGINPAYDEAVKFLAQDREEKLFEINKVKSKLQRMQQENKQTESFKDTIKAHEVNLERLQAMLEVNDPEVRWNFDHGFVDYTRPVYRHLARKRWEDRPMHILQQRIRQMNVVPDTIASIDPTAEIRMWFDDDTYLMETATEPGSILPSTSYAVPPKLEIIPYSPHEKYYTVLLLDLDCPDVKSNAYRTKIHWLLHNIHITPTSTILDTASSHVAFPYSPPLPFVGIKYHRYTLLVLEQSTLFDEAQIKQLAPDAAEVERFRIRRYLSMFHRLLLPTGISFWRGKVA